MANGLVNNGKYDTNGSFTAKTDLKRGLFVVPNYVDGTAAVPGADGVKNVYFVDNEVTTPKELGQADRNFVIKAGTKLKLRKFFLGATFTTTSLDAAIGTYAKGDVVGISADGKLKEAVATGLQATVKEVIANYDGEPALKCVVTVEA